MFSQEVYPPHSASNQFTKQRTNGRRERRRTAEAGEGQPAEQGDRSVTLTRRETRPAPRASAGTWVLPLEGGHAQVLADLLLQHVVLSGLVRRPLVLDQVLCRVVAEAGHRGAC